MIDTVLLDLDGTIVDTNELIIASFINTLESNGLAPLTREQIIPHMGLTLEQQLRAFSGVDDVTSYVTAYREYSAIHHDTMVAPFPEVTEVLTRLQAEGIKLGVVTTKIRPNTLKVLEMFQLDQFMEVIITQDDVEHTKPHPQPIERAMEALGSSPERTLMVGDSPADLQAASAAGVMSAAVAWSLKGEEELSKYHPQYILHTMSDLYELVLGDTVDR
ncbi:pyrophosphatase PpaX [Paenibacillus sp. PsM32]|uniref:pyrophosphatase PpaX n=1 Tax=unclassified Paenibacillus TaxID=185978 RepID=UPI002365F895|nr:MULTISPECIES: pyrophosphatase PpaX [unclassified Paenibacillus]MDN4619019.1 pyrophosphatase PpaX [Paenibacillus sp. PsM32]MDQ1236640.1 pyrophosphatase PpaX [Paenibacillus sp. SORGH_AS_0306]MDR6108998.1 pyrophosphatase PpaX [Paenibacillus sp. SORGH_AS_0338]WDF50780.1 pyrophosphatase PpaX [Paenibacillus sp. KACC 21273]